MEKLIMLLDIYEEEYIGVHSIGDKITEKDAAYLISKGFGFIKWLVDNNKIDNSKLSRESDMGFGDKYEREESLLMLLAISENPIEDLISYLK